MIDDYTVFESYTLPSRGKVYARQINPEVRLRSMTTIDEMRRLSKTDRPYKQLAEIIDDCLLDDLGMSSYDLCVGDFQYLLHRLRVVTYGPSYKLASTCPYCTCTSEDVVNLDDLAVIEYSDDILRHVEFDLPITKKHIKIRMQTPRMIDDVSVQNKADRKRTSSKQDSAFLLTIESLIEEVDGERLGFLDLENFVKHLPMMDTNVILEHSKKLNEGIGLDLTLDNTCDVCGYEYKSSFRTTSEFFGPTIDV